MIETMKITGVHTHLDKPMKKYVNKKIGQLDKYLPKQIRPSARAEVKLKEERIDGKQQSTCAVSLKLPYETLEATETSVSQYAAVDLVESKLKHQLKRYSDMHTSPKVYRRLFARMAKS